jgi:Family of unknown function (DUF6529)
MPDTPNDATSGRGPAPGSTGPAEAAPSPFRTAGSAPRPGHAAPAAPDPFRTAEIPPTSFHGAEAGPDPFRTAEIPPTSFHGAGAAPDPFGTAEAPWHSFGATDVAGPGPAAGGAQSPADDLWVAVPRARTTAAFVVPALVGAAVAVALGVYGRLHDPAGRALDPPVFSSALTFKVWMTTGSATLAVLQVLSALAMYGRLPRLAARPWLGVVHRYSGRLAFLLAVPVAVHCLYALGFQTYEPRVLVHSLVGCLFFGAFTVKMLALSKRGLAGWVLPLLGGLVFAGLVVLWLTSSLWFFTTIGVLR